MNEGNNWDVDGHSCRGGIPNVGQFGTNGRDPTAGNTSYLPNTRSETEPATGRQQTWGALAHHRPSSWASGPGTPSDHVRTVLDKKGWISKHFFFSLRYDSVDLPCYGACVRRTFALKSQFGFLPDCPAEGWLSIRTTPAPPRPLYETIYTGKH